MTRRTIDKVKKRDGRVVEYDEAKLASAIHRAARSAGQDNRHLAEDLAGVVTTYLDRYHPREIPTSDEIQRMVERILFETGHQEVARAYLLFRENKGRRSEPEERPTADLFPSESVLVEGATHDEVSTWGRDRISAALIKEAGVDPTTAGDIAAAVEQRVFKQGERRVSSTLIRELVNQELMARGHASKMRKQLVVGLPKYDLDRLIRPTTETEPAADPDQLCRMIGETTMKQYALQELHPREVADAHLEGRIHIHDLEYPLKLYWVATPVDELRRLGPRFSKSPVLSQPATRARTLTAQLGAQVAASARQIAGGLELPHLNSAYGALLAGASPEEIREEANHVAFQLAGTDRPPVWVGIDLAAPEAARQFALHLLQAPLNFVFSVPRSVFSEEEGVLLLREACRGAVERGRALFVFERGEQRRVSRFGVRSPQDSHEEPFAIAQAVTINIPQAFYRSEGGSDFYGELEVSLDLAVRAHLVKRNLIRRPGSEWSEYAIGVAGLDEAVRLLCGSDMSADENALRLGIRILSFLYFRVKEESDKHGLRMAIHDIEDGGATERFLRIDRQMFPRARGLESQIASMVAYTPGVHLRTFGRMKLDEALASESRFHTLMTQGTARISPALRATLSAAGLYQGLRHAGLDSLASQVAIS